MPNTKPFEGYTAEQVKKISDKDVTVNSLISEDSFIDMLIDASLEYNNLNEGMIFDEKIID